MTQAIAKTEGIPKKVSAAFAAIRQTNPKEAEEIENYLTLVKKTDITALGENEMFNLRDKEGEIRAFKRVVYLSGSDGTLVQPVDNRPFVISAQGYEILNEATGTIVMNADYVLVDGVQQQNPHVMRDKSNGRILAIYARAIAFRYSPLGIPQVSDRTTVFDVPAYRLIDLLAKAKKFPQAFTLLPNKDEPDKEGTWAKYSFDENTSLWVNTSHDEALNFYSQIINREKKAIDFAQTFSQRNASKHLHGLQKAPSNKWNLPVICWRPLNEGPLRWDVARYVTTQKALTELADGKTHGEMPQIDLTEGVDYVTGESTEEFGVDADMKGEDDNHPPDESKPLPQKTRKVNKKESEKVGPEEQPIREDPENPIWKQFDTTPEEFMAKAFKSLDRSEPVYKLEDAKKLLTEANTIADKELEM